MYKTLVNNNTQLNINNSVDTILESKDTISIITNANGSYAVSIDGESVIADIVEMDEETKMVSIKINQQLYKVAVQEPADLLLQKVGLTIATEKKVTQLKSAMPGLVLQLLVSPGQKVKKGDVLMIVEAMKMENLFKASADVVIGEIKVEEKEIIEKGQELISFL